MNTTTTGMALAIERSLLSVVIPCFNCAQTLGEQLDALSVQTYRGNWELIISDNRSTDQLAELVQQYQQVLPQLRYIRAEERQSRAHACNAGAYAARGSVLVFCDGDDIAAPDWLAQIAAQAWMYPMVAGAIEVEQLNTEAPWRPRPFQDAQQPILGFLPYAIGANTAIWRDLFVAVGGYDEHIPPCEDIDLAWRLQLAGVRIQDAPQAVMHYRYRSSEASMWRQIRGFGECHAFLYRRYRRYGMPRSSLQGAWDKLVWLYKNRHLRQGSKQQRARWLYTAAARWGRLRGSLRYRTLYL